MFRNKRQELGQTSVFEDREDPGVIDTRICSGKVSQQRTPESCGAHATWARAVVSISKMLSVFCLEEMHLCEV